MLNDLKISNMAVQRALKLEGFDVGEIDGIYGPKTIEQISKFQKRLNDHPDPRYSGKDSLRKKLFFYKPFLYAQYLIGTSEIPGKKHNSKIVEWFEAIGSKIRDDETAWCAAFVGGCLEFCGIKSSKSTSARSYLKWGESTDNPQPGDVVIFWRGSKKGWSGHVGFFVGIEGSDIVVLGGNQGNRVSIKKFKSERLLGFRSYSHLENSDYIISSSNFEFSESEK